MILENLNNERNLSADSKFLYEIIEKLEEVKNEIMEHLNSMKENKGELYYVYSYTPEKVYVTRQGSKKIELLENVSEEFKNNLAEGFILRYKNGMFIIDEELTRESMNFELDFDNYKD